MTEHRRGGSIINLASIMSRVPSSSAAYSVSKGGRVDAHEVPGAGARRERDPGQRDSAWLHRNAHDRGHAAGRGALALGVTPMGRYGTPDEIAATAVFLASDDASYFTGEPLHPSGGVFVG